MIPAESQGGSKPTSHTTAILGCQNLLTIRDYFEANGMFINNRKALNRYPDIKAEAECIVEKSRDLEMDDESWLRVQKDN